MTPNEILDNLRLVTKRYEKRVTSTGEVNISYMAEDAANCIENLLSETTALKAQCAELQKVLSPFVTLLVMLEAHYECAELGELPDSEVVASFMGSGASLRLTVRNLREIRSTLAAALKESEGK